MKESVKSIEEYLPIVREAAWRLHRRFGLPQHIHEDLVQEGFVGLLRARPRYDPTRGVSFTTFAWKRIEGTMLSFIRKEARGIDLHHEHTQQPVEAAVAAREALTMVGIAIDRLPCRRKIVMESVVRLESLELAAEEAAVSMQRARAWRREILGELRELAA